MLQLYFLILLYIGYIVYGASSCLISSIWPTYSVTLGVATASLAIINVAAYIASGIASGNAYMLRRKIGNNFSIVLGMLLIATSIIIYIVCHSFVVLLIGVIVVGMGGGIVDSISSNYVVKYHRAQDVSYLHACWGLGSSIGPMVMSYSISKTNGFSKGFGIMFAFVALLIVVFIFTKIFWEHKKKSLPAEEVKKYTISEEEKNDKTNLLGGLKIKYAALFAFLALFGYCANGTMNTWLTTILSEQRGVSAVEGATAASVFFFALTITRLLIGFVSNKLSTSKIVILSLIVSIFASALLFMPIKNIIIIYVTAAVLGIGIAPFAPFLTYNIKEIFGEKDLALLISLISVCNLLGSALSSAIAGPIEHIVGAAYIPCALIIYLLISLVSYIVLLKKRAA